MKYALLVVILSSQFCFAQTHQEPDGIGKLIRIWGLLKYKHPDCSKGRFDMNSEFINEFERIKDIKNPDLLNDELLRWASTFNTAKTRFRSTQAKDDSKHFTKNEDFSWIDNSGFNAALVAKLKLCKNNTAIGMHYALLNPLNGYPDFSSDKPLPNFDASNQAHRILFLSSFWNTARYWNVNIHLTDKKWDNLLTEMIPSFLNNGAENFELAKEFLIAQLNDSHADYPESRTMKKLTKFPLYEGRLVNDSLVVTVVRNATLAKIENIDPGDVIFAADNKPLAKYLHDKFDKVISASNTNHIRAQIEKFFLLASNNDSINISYVKVNGSIHNKYIKLYGLGTIARDYKYLTLPDNHVWYRMTDSIGYINMGKITKSELKIAFKNLNSAKGIIVDLRSYPKTGDEITDYLYPDKKTFVKVLVPKLPSVGEYDAASPVRIIKNPFAAGRNNKNYYKGKIVLLVDRGTASKGEWVGMMVQQSPRCITIGEQTAGAVMNRVTVKLMDGTTVDFTGGGAFYPDGTGVQRKGLRIDKFITESAMNYNPGIYIEEAIEILNK